MSDPVTIVSRFVDAANRHDADAIAKCLHPDFESIQPIYPSRNFRGSVQVKRNWQAIFESEPGFRLSLVRSASSESTVWVELHGAGRDVEVAGVFIMGVEGELVRWARVYSAVVEQPPPKMAVHEPEGAVAAEESVSLREEAEELRRLIDAGRPADAPADGDEGEPADDDEPLVEVAVGAVDEVPAEGVEELVGEVAAVEPPVAEGEAEIIVGAPAAESPAAEGPADVVAVADEDYEDEDYEDEDGEDDEDDDDEDDEDGEDDEANEADEADGIESEETVAADLGQADGGDGGGERGAVAAGEVDGGVEAGERPSEPDLPSPYADIDTFWNGGEVHDLVGGATREWRPDLEALAAAGGALGDDEDALVVDLTGRRAELGDDDGDDTTAGRSGRRRGGRRHH